MTAWCFAHPWMTFILAICTMFFVDSLQVNIINYRMKMKAAELAASKKPEAS